MKRKRLSAPDELIRSHKRRRKSYVRRGGVDHRGGPREGNGRPKGSRNKFSLEVAEAARLTGKLPHEIMLEIARGGDPWKDLNLPGHEITIEHRLDMLKACANYYAAKYTTTEIHNKGGPLMTFMLPPEMLKQLPTDKLVVLEEALSMLQSGKLLTGPTIDADPNEYAEAIEGA